MGSRRRLRIACRDRDRPFGRDGADQRCAPRSRSSVLAARQLPASGDRRERAPSRSGHSDCGRSSRKRGAGGDEKEENDRCEWLRLDARGRTPRSGGCPDLPSERDRQSDALLFVETLPSPLNRRPRVRARFACLEIIMYAASARRKAVPGRSRQPPTLERVPGEPGALSPSTEYSDRGRRRRHRNAVRVRGLGSATVLERSWVEAGHLQVKQKVKVPAHKGHRQHLTASYRQDHPTANRAGSEGKRAARTRAAKPTRPRRTRRGGREAEAQGPSHAKVEDGRRGVEADGT